MINRYYYLDDSNTAMTFIDLCNWFGVSTSEVSDVEDLADIVIRDNDSTRTGHKVYDILTKETFNF